MENQSYVADEAGHGTVLQTIRPQDPVKLEQNGTPTQAKPLREKWGRNLEFLMSCVALSVGFGNVWRFPHTAYVNGGGAFVIPYLIVLFVIGRPIYYLEMVLGQFSNRGCVKVYDLAPAMRGIGVGQTIAIFTVITYYTAVLAITLRYLIVSFSAELPWARCDPSWTDCIDSWRTGNLTSAGDNGTLRKASAELYFDKTVMHSYDSLDGGLGYPDWKLVLCLIVSWLCIVGVLIKGIKSSGKVSYFLAIFPYIIIAILLVRSVTLEGAWNGISFFFMPQWDKLLDIKVWYAAVTQCFFSLTICFGGLIAYSSFNNFSNNIYQHAVIITSLDTATSLVAGCVVFGVIGHLAHVTGQSDISKVVKGGFALTFKTYPDVLAKFTHMPQFFSVLFFFMLFLLGIGTLIGIVTSVITAIHDQQPRIVRWKIVIGVAVVGFCVGLVYLTPGGLIVLDLLDYFGATLATLTLAGFELATFAWIYGVNRVCKDIEFMLGIKTGLFWRICWGIVTPVLIIIILIISFIDFEVKKVPTGYNALGWCLFAFSALQLPGWAIYAILKRKGPTWRESVRAAFRPMADWGPEDDQKRANYSEWIEQYRQRLAGSSDNTLLHKMRQKLFS
ncbi:Sodium and chloride-dependent glycine transporter [Anopheles darlingi]|uniref:Sodium-dependent nutrient amino acid transporter 1 n=1 Tax=Anopheles darlingi TaxID=43151 RepID=W5JFD3_ANODA|nr:Sodium and chloride-dependent glycine transporter [Anopheles darlingi]